jgi:hypothetical protein
MELDLEENLMIQNFNDNKFEDLGNLSDNMAKALTM